MVNVNEQSSPPIPPGISHGGFLVIVYGLFGIGTGISIAIGVTDNVWYGVAVGAALTVATTALFRLVQRSEQSVYAAQVAYQAAVSKALLERDELAPINVSELPAQDNTRCVNVMCVDANDRSNLFTLQTSSDAHSVRAVQTSPE